MKIYQSEQDIKDIILFNSSKAHSVLSTNMNITEAKPEIFFKSLSNNKLDKLTSTLASLVEQEHPDLMYGSAILVSTIWNLNDDIFLPEDTWNAIASSVNQPFNDNHVEYDIIGHIINATPLDLNGNVISECNDYFDVSVDFVVYKSIFPKVTAEIAEKAPINEKFVSMEARFNSFDYGLLDEDGNLQVVARNEDTAFLTKYLRAYGGNGLYNKYKIGRVLRDFRFVGMGSVDKPANPASKFTRIENYSSDESFEKQLVSLNKAEGKKMDELLKAQEKISALESELTAVKAEKDTQKTEIASLNEKLNVANTKAEVAEQKVTEFTAQIETLNKTLDETKAELVSFKGQIDEINKNAKANERFAKLTELKIELNDEQKAKIKDMNDESFASIVEFTKDISSKVQASVVEDLAKKEAETKAELEKAEENKEKELPENAGDQSSPEQEMFKVAASLVENLRKNRKNLRNVKK